MIVATNVAETSLTIPNISYVIDTGKVNRKIWDLNSGVSKFEISWISQASAEQRAGRSGRTSTGYCYRLYSSAVYANDFEKFEAPIIQQRPVADVLLYMKSLDIPKVVNFPFPSPPSKEGLKNAEKNLINLGAIEAEQSGVTLLKKDSNLSGKITKLGRIMAKFPAEPRYAKMLAHPNQENILPLIIALVATFTVKDIWLNENDVSKEVLITKKSLIKKWISKFEPLGDIMVLLGVVGSCSNFAKNRKDQINENETDNIDNKSNSRHKLKLFCEKLGLRHKAMVEIFKQMRQIEKIYQTNINPEFQIKFPLQAITEPQAQLITQTIVASFGEQISVKNPNLETNKLTGVSKNQNKRTCYQTCNLEENVFLHNSSSFANKSYSSSPTWICYNEICETNFSRNMYMRNVIEIKSPSILANLCPNHCTFSKPIYDELDETSLPYYDNKNDKIFCNVTAIYGPQSWKIPGKIEIEFPNQEYGLDKFRWFGRFLLEGKVYQQLTEIQAYLKLKPSFIVKIWAADQKIVQGLVNFLANYEVCSKKQLDHLENKLKRNLIYLLGQFYTENDQDLVVEKLVKIFGVDDEEN